QFAFKVPFSFFAAPPVHSTFLDRPHNPADCACYLFPSRFFGYELLSPCWGQSVKLELTIAILRDFPFRTNPAPAFKPMQSRVRGPVLHLQNVSCRALNMLCDLVSVRGPEQKNPQDQHVERTLKKSNSDR